METENKTKGNATGDSSQIAASEEHGATDETIHDHPQSSNDGSIGSEQRDTCNLKTEDKDKAEMSEPKPNKKEDGILETAAQTGTDKDERSADSEQVSDVAECTETSQTTRPKENGDSSMQTLQQNGEKCMDAADSATKTPVSVDGDSGDVDKRESGAAADMAPLPAAIPAAEPLCSAPCTRPIESCPEKAKVSLLQQQGQGQGQQQQQGQEQKEHKAKETDDQRQHDQPTNIIMITTEAMDGLDANNEGNVVINSGEGSDSRLYFVIDNKGACKLLSAEELQNSNLSYDSTICASDETTIIQLLVNDNLPGSGASPAKDSVEMSLLKQSAHSQHTQTDSQGREGEQNPGKTVFAAAPELVSHTACQKNPDVTILQDNALPSQQSAEAQPGTVNDGHEDVPRAQLELLKTSCSQARGRGKRRGTPRRRGLAYPRTKRCMGFPYSRDFVESAGGHWAEGPMPARGFYNTDVSPALGECLPGAGIADLDSEWAAFHPDLKGQVFEDIDPLTGFPCMPRYRDDFSQVCFPYPVEPPPAVHTGYRRPGGRGRGRERECGRGRGEGVRQYLQHRLLWARYTGRSQEALRRVLNTIRQKCSSSLDGKSVDPGMVTDNGPSIPPAEVGVGAGSWPQEEVTPGLYGPHVYNRLNPAGQEPHPIMGYPQHFYGASMPPPGPFGAARSMGSADPAFCRSHLSSMLGNMGPVSSDVTPASFPIPVGDTMVASGGAIQKAPARQNTSTGNEGGVQRNRTNTADAVLSGVTQTGAEATEQNGGPALQKVNIEIEQLIEAAAATDEEFKQKNQQITPPRRPGSGRRAASGNKRTAAGRDVCTQKDSPVVKREKRSTPGKSPAVRGASGSKRRGSTITNTTETNPVPQRRARRALTFASPVREQKERSQLTQTDTRSEQSVAHSAVTTAKTSSSTSVARTAGSKSTLQTSSADVQSAAASGISINIHVSSDVTGERSGFKAGDSDRRSRSEEGTSADHSVQRPADDSHTNHYAKLQTHPLLEPYRQAMAVEYRRDPGLPNEMASCLPRQYYPPASADRYPYYVDDYNSSYRARLDAVDRYYTADCMQGRAMPPQYPGCPPDYTYSMSAYDMLPMQPFPGEMGHPRTTRADQRYQPFPEQHAAKGVEKTAHMPEGLWGKEKASVTKTAAEMGGSGEGGTLDPDQVDRDFLVVEARKPRWFKAANKPMMPPVPQQPEDGDPPPSKYQAMFTVGPRGPGAWQYQHTYGQIPPHAPASAEAYGPRSHTTHFESSATHGLTTHLTQEAEEAASNKRAGKAWHEPVPRPYEAWGGGDEVQAQPHCGGDFARPTCIQPPTKAALATEGRRH